MFCYGQIERVIFRTLKHKPIAFRRCEQNSLFSAAAEFESRIRNIASLFAAFPFFRVKYQQICRTLKSQRYLKLFGLLNLRLCGQRDIPFFICCIDDDPMDSESAELTVCSFISPVSSIAQHHHLQIRKRIRRCAGTGRNDNCCYALDFARGNHIFSPNSCRYRAA